MKPESPTPLDEVSFRALIKGTYRVIADDLDDATQKVKFMLANSARCEVIKAEFVIKKIENDLPLR